MIPIKKITKAIEPLCNKDSKSLISFSNMYQEAWTKNSRQTLVNPTIVVIFVAVWELLSTDLLSLWSLYAKLWQINKNYRSIYWKNLIYMWSLHIIILSVCKKKSTALWIFMFYINIWADLTIAFLKIPMVKNG